jgi:hypothetical protein
MQSFHHLHSRTEWLRLLRLFQSPREALRRSAYASAGKESTSHPRKVVMNAFLRRGFQPFATRGNALRYSRQMPARAGWGPATPITFSEKVEAWD